MAGGASRNMQGWYIGITAASQAVKAGSTPVPCSTQLKRPMHRCIGRFCFAYGCTLRPNQQPF